MGSLAKTTGALGYNFARIIRQTNVDRQVMSPHWIKVIIPGGFPYEAFNSQAYVRPWSLIRMVECSRAAVFNKVSNSDVSFLQASELYKDYLMFNASTTMKISPDLYDLSSTKSPLEIDVKLDYVGKTTFKLRTEVSVEGVDAPVCENETQTVLVSNKTRMPTAPPDWWIDTYSLGENNGESLKLQRLTEPENKKFVNYPVIVPPSDADPYMHLNWANWIKYCYNAFTAAELKKYGPEEAIKAFRNMKFYTTSYIKEVNIGDIVNVRFWQSESQPDLYHFQLLKDSEVAGECNVELFAA